MPSWQEHIYLMGLEANVTEAFIYNLFTRHTTIRLTMIKFPRKGKSLMKNAYLPSTVRQH
jgi:hypothetical protein